MARKTIREFSGMIIGYIDEEYNGDKYALDFSGRKLGYYKASDDTTRDMMGRILYKGDMVSCFLIKK